MEKKVVELPGGKQAPVSKDVLNIGGSDILDNNQVRPLMVYLILGKFRHDVLHNVRFNGVIRIAFLLIIIVIER